MRAAGQQTNKKNTQQSQSYLQIYSEMPTKDFSIDEIVTFASLRNRLHEELRSLNERDDIDNENRQKQVNSLFTRYFIPLKRIMNSAPINNDVIPEEIINSYNQKEIDQNEFYSLLLISLKNEDLQRSFIQGECQIFKYRLIYSGSAISINDIPREILQKTNIDFDSYLNGNTFSIPFNHIFPYIDVTHCELKDGKVNLSFTDMTSIFTSFYKSYLERRFAAFRRLEIQDSELSAVLSDMYNEKIGAFFTQDRTNWNIVSLDDIENLAHRSFPPCMYNMYTKLKTSHKLFHTGRLQLGLFLKGIGLSMNDSLKLWRDEFSKFGIPLDQFERQYAYNIRYNYGKEGSCRNFSPYSCMGMIRMPAPAIGQTHGCPFIQMRKEDCKSILVRMFRDSKKNKGSSFMDKCEFLAEKGQKHPQIACTELFNFLHSKEYEDSAVRHPCEYFSFSEEQFKEESSK